MKTMRATLIMLLMLCLAMPTMAAAQPVSAMGRYVEKEIALPEGITGVYSMALNEQGAITLYAAMNDKIVVWTLGADGAWTEESPAWAETLEKMENLIEFAICKDEIWLLCYSDESNGYRPRIGRLVNGSFEEARPKDLEADAFVERFAIAEGGQLVVGIYEGGVRVFDADGREIESFDECENFRLQGQTLTVLNDHSAIEYDLDAQTTRAQIDDAPSTGRDMIGRDMLYNDGEAVYIANGSGIYRVALGGSLWERMVDGELTSLRSPSMGAISLVIDRGEPLVLFSSYGNGNAWKLMRYTYDESVPTLPANELKVYTLRENSLLTQAASVFQNAHPEYLVRITELLADDTAATASDVIRALNTELLAGMGPDVLLLDGMPRDSYIEKGVLMDLTPVIEPMLENGELIKGIVGAMQSDNGKLYAVPSNFAMPVAMGDPDALANCASIADLVALSESRASDAAALGARTREGYYSMLLPGSFPAWFDADGAFREDMFRAFLEAIDAIWRVSGVEEDAYADMIYTAIFADQAQLDDMDLMGGRTNELIALKNGNLALHPFILDNFLTDMIELTALADMRGAIIGLPGQAQNVFLPEGLIGVNAASAQTDAATDFVRTLLSESVQDMETYSGFPINAVSFGRLVDKTNGRIEVGTSVTDEESGIMLELHGTWPTDAVRARVSELANELHTPYIADAELLDMMKTELKSFFAGQADAVSAAKSVSARVRAYLAE